MTLVKSHCDYKTVNKQLDKLMYHFVSCVTKSTQPANSDQKEYKLRSLVKPLLFAAIFTYIFEAKLLMK